MNNKRSLFNIVTCKMKPRHMRKELNKIFVTRSNESDFSFMQKNSVLYRNLEGKQYILQIDDNISVESYFFTVYNSPSGFYLMDNKELKKFHNLKNCLKYKLAKTYRRNHWSSESIRYICLRTNEYLASGSMSDALYNGYKYGQRINIMGMQKTDKSKEHYNKVTQIYDILRESREVGVYASSLGAFGEEQPHIIGGYILNEQKRELDPSEDDDGTSED